MKTSMQLFLLKGNISRLYFAKLASRKTISIIEARNHCLFLKCYLNSPVKALSHGAIFLATCNAILLLRDVNL